MAGKPNTAWMATMIKKYGSKEAVSEYMAKGGAKGGRNGHTGGFAANPKLAAEARRKGGKISKPRSKMV